MKTRIFIFCTAAFLYFPGIMPLITASNYGYPQSLSLTIGQASQETSGVEDKEQKKLLSGQKSSYITEMEGLDLVKSKYASNFIREYTQAEMSYYYKLPIAQYYLVYEGEGGSASEYLYHLYEYVLEDSEEGIGHTVTYGWYKVDKYTGKITEIIQ